MGYGEKLCGLLVAAALAGRCADFHWTGAAGDHLWSTAGNWVDSAGKAVAAGPQSGKTYTYNFTDYPEGLVVTQDIDVVIGGCATHRLAEGKGRNVTWVSLQSKGKSARMRFDVPSSTGLWIGEDTRLTLKVDLSAHTDWGKWFYKHQAGALVFDLLKANPAALGIAVKGGTVEVAESGAAPLLGNVNFECEDWDTGYNAPPRFVDRKNAGLSLNTVRHQVPAGTAFNATNRWSGGIALGEGSALALATGAAVSSGQTNAWHFPVYANAATLEFSAYERCMSLFGLPLGGTLATRGADVEVRPSPVIIRWDFEDAANPTRDIVGRGADLLAPKGMPEVVTDAVRGKVLRFDRGARYLAGNGADGGLPGLQPYDAGNAFTIAFWLKPDAGNQATKKIFGWGTSNKDYRFAGLRLNLANKAKSLMFTPWGNNIEIPTSAAVDNGDWHHVAIVYGGMRHIYVHYDGVLVEARYIDENVYRPDNRAFSFGCCDQWAKDDGFSGCVDDVLLMACALDRDSVETLYAKGLAALVPSRASALATTGAGEVTLPEEVVRLAALTGTGLTGGATLATAGAELTVGEDATGEGEFAATLRGDGASLVKAGDDSTLVLSGVATGVTNVEVRAGTLVTRRPLARDGVATCWTFDNPAAPGRDLGFARYDFVDGAPEFVEDGVAGRAVRFDGSYGAVLMTSADETLPGSFPQENESFTASLWLRPAADCPNNAPLIVWGWQSPDAGQPLRSTLLRLDDSMSGVRFSNWSEDLGTADTNHNLADGAWHHVAAVYDAANKAKEIYIDGARVARKEGVQTLNVAAVTRLCLGANKYNDVRYRGDLDEVMVIDRAWTADEVQAAYRKVRPAAVAATARLPRPVARWTFDDAENPTRAVAGGDAFALTREGEVAIETGEAINGGAARFSSTSGFFRLADEQVASLMGGSVQHAFTAVVRYRPDTVQGDFYPAILTWGGEDDKWYVGGLFRIGTGQNTELSIRVVTSCTNAVYAAPGSDRGSDAAPDHLRWHTVAVSYSPSGFGIGRICIDGTRAWSHVAVTRDHSLPMANFAIGSSPDGKKTFYGLVDDVAIYDRFLSDGEIRAVTEALEAGTARSARTEVDSTVFAARPNVTVAAGATLRVESDEAFASLAGAGAVAVGPLATLTLDGVDGFAGTLTGRGTVAIADGATLTLGADGAPALAAKCAVALGRNVTVDVGAAPKAGAYTLVTAAAYAGAENLATWTVTDGGQVRGARVTLSADGTAVVARPAGMTIFVR